VIRIESSHNASVAILAQSILPRRVASMATSIETPSGGFDMFTLWLVLMMVLIVLQQILIWWLVCCRPPHSVHGPATISSPPDVLAQPMVHAMVFLTPQGELAHSSLECVSLRHSKRRGDLKQLRWCSICKGK
jgi:hypothetical protein